MRAVALLGGALLLLLVPWPAAWVERLYLGLLHPAWSALTARLVDASGASLSALLALLLVVVPLLVLLTAWRTAGRAVLRFWGYAALWLLLLFPLTFALGYKLPPLEQRPTVQLVELDPVTLEALGREVLARLERGASSPLVDSRQLASREALAAASLCVARTSAALRGGAPPALPERIKRLPAGLLLRFGFAGVVSPWLLEPHVDGGLPPAAALGVALHEFAHTAGFAPEAEAEAVGLLAGLYCHDERVAYAAALRVATGLAAALPEGERRAFRASWPQRARNDQRAAALAAARYRSPRLAPGVEAAYELYLKSQGEVGGLLEYDRGTELALRLIAARLTGPG